MMTHLENDYKNFYISFLIIIIVNIVNFYTNFINSNINRILEVFIGLHIFLSIFFVTYKINFINFFLKGKNKLFFILLLYCLFQFLRPPAAGYGTLISNYWLSKFGGLNYDALFLLPLFYFWSFHENSIYWFERLSLLSVKIGILLIPICYLLNLPIFYVAFFPTYYLLAGYEYSDLKRKIWILSGFLIGNCFFFIEVHRSGNIRSILILLVLFIIKLNSKKINIISNYIFLTIPLIFFMSYFYLEQSVFILIFEKINLTDSIYSVDTRTFIYADLIDHFTSFGNIIIGDGGFANYYSDYFYKWKLQFTSGDNPFRVNSEVGLLGIILKGGLFLLLLIFLLIFNSIQTSYKYSNNNYTKTLSLVIGTYFMFTCVENAFVFDLLNISFWVMLSIVGNIKLNSFNEKEMMQIFEKVNNDS